MTSSKTPNSPPASKASRGSNRTVTNEGRAVEILGRERRLRWTEAEKLEILAALEAPGASLAHVARRYDVSQGRIHN